MSVRIRPIPASDHIKELWIAQDRATEIIRKGDERLAAIQRERDLAIFQAVHAGKPLTIFGVKYVPATEEA
jgi:hypothetical protein